MRDAPPAGEHLGWSVPAPLLGGIDVAATGTGAVPIVSIHGGRARAPRWCGTHRSPPRPLVALPVTLTVDLRRRRADARRGHDVRTLSPERVA